MVDDFVAPGEIRKSLAGGSAEGAPGQFWGLEDFRLGDFVSVTGNFYVTPVRPLLEVGGTLEGRRVYYSAKARSSFKGVYLGWRYGRGATSSRWSRIHFIMATGDPGQLGAINELIIVDDGDPNWPLEADSFDVEFQVLSKGDMV